MVMDMRTRGQEVTNHHLRSMTDGESTINRINYLVYCLATGREQELHSGENGGPEVFVPLDDLRTKQVIAALAGYNTILARVLPALKPMDYNEAIAPALEGRDFSAMDRLDLANRLRVVFERAFKQRALAGPVISEEEFLS